MFRDGKLIDKAELADPFPLIELGKPPPLKEPREVSGRMPPKTHNLIRLLKLSELTLPSELLDLLGRLSSASIATGYPEDFEETIKAYTKDVAEVYLKKSEEIVQWITG